MLFNLSNVLRMWTIRKQFFRWRLPIVWFILVVQFDCIWILRLFENVQCLHFRASKRATYCSNMNNRIRDQRVRYSNTGPIIFYEYLNRSSARVFEYRKIRRVISAVRSICMEYIVGKKKDRSLVKGNVVPRVWLDTTCNSLQERSLFLSTISRCTKKR